MQLSTFSPETTKRELLEFCKGRVLGYSKHSKQGKAALLAFVNRWIAAESVDELIDDVEPSVKYLKSRDFDRQPTEAPAPVAPTVAAYTVYLATIVVGTLILWLLDIPLLALKVWRFAQQQWIDVRLQLQYVEWPQVWLPAMQLAIVNW
ncbi:MAG: hypothetical protein AB4050_01770 [Synechococcus sp.]